MTITGGDSQNHSTGQLSLVQSHHSDGKKNRLNIEDLKRYLMKD